VVDLLSGEDDMSELESVNAAVVVAIFLCVYLFLIIFMLNLLH